VALTGPDAIPTDFDITTPRMQDRLQMRTSAPTAGNGAVRNTVE
jgi:hypothetical protein